MPIKVTKTLYIGVGGTGVRALLNTKKAFIENYGEVPPMVQFLAIDTDKGISNWNVTTSDDRKVTLDNSELSITTVPSAMSVYQNFRSDYDWLPEQNSEYLSSIAGIGAGAVRSNGRFIAQNNSATIRTAILNKVTAVCRPIPVGSKYQADVNNAGIVKVAIHVVGSVAGGTGSGMMIDVITLIKEHLNTNGFKDQYSIWPWLVMPEVFKLMTSISESANCIPNAYGFMREFDYLLSMNADSQPLQFMYTKSNGFVNSEVPLVMSINNKNTNGVSFDNISDIADSMGRSLFLLAVGMGGFVDTLNNNMLAGETGMQAILGQKKRFLYISSGSAELIYDNKAVLETYDCTYVRRICDILRQPSDSAKVQQEAYNWMVNVGIQEHNYDQVIDTLLNPYDYEDFKVEKDCGGYIDSHIDASLSPYHISVMQKKESDLSDTAKKEFDKEIKQRLLEKGTGDALTFVQELKNWITECKKEMNHEISDHNLDLQKPIDWDREVKNCFGFFGAKRSEVESLQSLIKFRVALKRNVERKKESLNFYTSFESYVNGFVSKITSLDNALRDSNILCGNRIAESDRAAPADWQVPICST